MQPRQFRTQGRPDQTPDRIGPTIALSFTVFASLIMSIAP